ncbi:putative pentatricopeptide repeat-containing protein at3g15130 [Phtheirospermum japonicum]|uniref:Putative pentatricopeptide repeat-containing protein at3g15130 n=1 Tax=Phtheirospermum japonicum TaxID=374723 RepID=A0A830BK14_9LAMI|nr:putative pentatricopeptide repeat-containing protein at3g15130 [Phtheirospermum japonicum]
MIPKNLGHFLHRCTKKKAFRIGISFHAVAIKTGTQSDILISNHILNLYAKCGRLESAHQLFDEMPDRNLVTWSAMISGYDQSKQPHSALQLFIQMLRCHDPNEFVFASALSSCSAIKDLNLGQQIHALSLKSTHASVPFVHSSLIMMYMKCGNSVDVSLFFKVSESKSSTLVAYNVAIGGLVKNNQPEKAIEMFIGMCRQDLVPDRFTFAALLGPGEPVHDLSVVMQLHCQMVKLRLANKPFSGNVLIILYSRFNLMDEPEKAFRSIVKKDVISWNTAIAIFRRFNENSKALSVFREMVMRNKARPDDYTYAAVLSAAAGRASMRNGKEIHAHLIRRKPDWDIGIRNALINMYAKSGCLSSAYAIFERMQARNLVSWNSIIAAFSYHGLAEKAIESFAEMMRIGLKPDNVTFLEILTACNHSGLVSEGEAIFNSMVEVYGINPSVEHLCSLVDLLGRAGRVNEAEEYMHKYSSGDDAVILGSLLSACRLHGGVSGGEEIANRLLALDPITTSPFVLLSNLYASNRNWDGVFGARTMQQISGLKKEAGRSEIEVKGSVEKFTVGDFSHSRMDEIVNLLTNLTRRSKDEDAMSY